jgi:hypothetical protein
MLMIEVRLRPGVPGCVTVPLAIMTLGLVPLADAQGANVISSLGWTSKGSRPAAARTSPGARSSASSARWAKVQGMKMSDELVLYTRKGRVSLPTWRTENADEALAFFQAHAPGETKS